MGANPLHVLIAGGGLSGLTLAHGLRNAGHTCDVFERDADLTRKSGYYLNMNADGGEALRRCLPGDLFQLYAATSRRTGERGGSVVLDDQLNELSRQPHFGPPNDREPPHTGVHRRTLRQILLARLDGAFHPGKPVVAYAETPAGVSVTLADGTTAEGDIPRGSRRRRGRREPRRPLAARRPRCGAHRRRTRPGQHARDRLHDQVDAVMSAPRVELLWWSGCPSHGKAKIVLEQAMVEAGLGPAGLETLQIVTDEEAIRERFVGSPTIRVAGRDIAPDDTTPAAWDIEAAAAGYEELLEDFGELVATTPEQCFAAWMRLSQAWRRCAQADPGLPGNVLPPDWARRRTAEVVAAGRARWRPDATAYFAALSAKAGPAPTGF